MSVRGHETAPPRRRLLSLIASLCRWLGLSVFLFCALCFAIKLTVGDLIPPFHWLFYFPSMILLPLSLLALVPVIATRPRLGSSLFAVGLVGLIPLWLEEPFFFRAETVKEPGAISLLVYNVEAYRRGDKQINEVISNAKVDIVCVVEGTFGNRAPDKLKRHLGSEYTWVTAGRLSVASRIPIAYSQLVAGKQDYALQRVEFAPEDQEPFAVYVLDMNTPWRRSGEAFETLRELIKDEQLPHLIVGDFNVPRSSRQLSRLTEGLVDAFETGGLQGRAATWPSEFPLLQLDYIYTCKRIDTKEAAVITSLASDHLPLRISFDVTQSSPTNSNSTGLAMNP